VKTEIGFYRSRNCKGVKYGENDTAKLAQLSNLPSSEAQKVMMGEEGKGKAKPVAPIRSTAGILMKGVIDTEKKRRIKHKDDEDPDYDEEEETEEKEERKVKPPRKRIKLDEEEEEEEKERKYESETGRIQGKSDTGLIQGKEERNEEVRPSPGKKQKGQGEKNTGGNGKEKKEEGSTKLEALRFSSLNNKSSSSSSPLFPLVALGSAQTGGEGNK
jgi:hypothetical protein